MGRVTLAGILFFLFLVNHSFAQEEEQRSYRYHLDHDKKTFEDVMESETRVSDRKDSLDISHAYYLIPQELPEWMFSPGKYATSDNFFIGISNPGMDSLNAVKLAKHRAIALLILSGETQVDNVSDNFMVSREQAGVESQYLDFTRFSRNKVLQGNGFKINKTFYTKYGEGLALVSLQPTEKKQADTLEVHGELMQLAREDDFGLENTVFCKMRISRYPATCMDDTVVSDYVYKGRNRKFNLHTQFQGDTIDFPVHPYRYVSSCDTTDINKAVVSNSLSVGLWNSFVNTLFSNISYYNKNLDASVKSSYDNYSLKSQGIIRTVSRNHLSFSLERIVINDNEMVLHLDWQEHN